MKERPILFSGPMVRAILEGRKTQTRRVVKPQPHPDATLQGIIPRPNADRACASFAHVDERGVHSHSLKVQCPFGRGGDRLWVRETWAPCSVFEPSEETGSIHRAGPWRNGLEPSVKWRPSIHMPRWASRITLEITDVRVERLQDISEADAKAEGVNESIVLPGDRGSFVASFGYLWESIHGAGSWCVNPWVWVIEFERVKG